MAGGSHQTPANGSGVERDGQIDRDVNYWQKGKSWFIPADYETPVGNQGGCRLGSQTCGAHLEKMCREEARPKPEGRHRRQSLQRGWRESSERARRETRRIRAAHAPKGPPKGHMAKNFSGHRGEVG